MTALDQYSAMGDGYMQSVFSIINQNSGKLNFKALYSRMAENGSPNKIALYRAIAVLTKEGRIKRVKGIGINGIDYFYHDSALCKFKARVQGSAGVMA